ncbi:LysR family transcriptional regulator [Gordonia soli]|uniref:Putative LysR family transcriptional regulator n=1 Tax=Gordonia soli NBRC 108243 TaxID=1223545 RepID=M0QJD6_9ACTN|nr:LysR substrate-binding domain-containing protein [Gordonia soli]GAC68678.1 putative LysR family transcriptional regulator [Gordonia soli NBRC 108243]
MDFRHLRSYVMLAEELHFGRAAARLHLSQPSLSAQIQKLERSLGVTLVNRTSHEVALTSSGVEFAKQARMVLAQMDKAVDVAKSAAAGQVGSLAIGYNFPASRHMLPAALSLLNERHPKVAVSLWEMRTGPQMDGIADGSLDVAFVYGKPHGVDVRSRLLLSRVPIVAVVGRTHPWAGRISVRCAELGDQPCVLFAREQCPAMYDVIVGAANEAGARLSIAQHADDPSGTGQLVAIKPLVAFASLARAAAVGMGTAGASSVAVKLIDPVPTIDLYMAWSADSGNSAVQALVDCVADVATREDTVTELHAAAADPVEPMVGAERTERQII